MYFYVVSLFQILKSLLKQLSYILILTFLLLSLSCKIFKQKGWADNFKYALDQEKYNGKGSGKGWASNFQSPFSRERFSKSDGWATNFGSHDNFSKHCKNKGWAIDFRSNLKSDRFNNSGSGFFVLSSPKYEALKFSDSFSSGSRKAKEGGFVFNDKNKSVKKKWIFNFKSKPITKDSFGSNVEKKHYKDNVYNKKKKRVTKTKGLFKRKREKPYKRKKDMELDLFQFKP